MNPVFLGEFPLAPGDYLTGHFSWTGGRVLRDATLIGTPAPDRALVFALEVDGVLTGHEFSLPAGTATEVRLSLPLNLTLAAGEEVRWKVRGTGAAAGGPVTITVSSGPPSRLPDPELRVDYVNGPERLTVYTYDPDTAEFTATPYAAGRVTLTAGVTEFTVLLGATLVLRVQVGGTEAEFWRESPLPDSPRIEFMRAQIRCMSCLTSRVDARLTEADPEAVGRAGFEFRVGATLAATLTPAGLTAPVFVEPLS